MAGTTRRLPMANLSILFAVGLLTSPLATPVKISLQSVSDLVIQSALDSLNEKSPTGNTYKGGNLLSAQKLKTPPYVIYRLTLNLETNCPETSCPREACAIEIKQHESGVIEIENESKQCVFLYPQSDQRSSQDIPDDQLIESLDRQINDSVNLDHEVQEVSDHNDRPFIAVRASHYCPGCPYELNPTLPGLEIFGELAATSLDDSGRSDFKHRIVSIVRVTRAVPPGSNVVRYELLMEVGETNCLRTTVIQRSKCSLQTNVPIRLCQVRIDENPWQHNSRQIVFNNCTDSDKANGLTGQVDPTLTSESLITENCNDYESQSEIYDQVALEGQLSTYQSPVESSVVTAAEDSSPPVVTEVPFKRIFVETERPEVIPKFADKFREFDDFLEGFDIDIRPTTEHSHGPEVVEEMIRPERVKDQISVEITRTKREIDNNYDKSLILKLSQKALSILDEMDNDDKKRVIADVVDYKRISSEGFLYQITLLVAPGSNCREDHKNIKDCIHDPEGEPMNMCKLQIQTDDKSTLETAKVLQSQCYEIESRRKRQLLGGPQVISVDDPEVQRYVGNGLRKYSAEMEGDNEPMIIQVIEATRQTVAGSLYKIKVEIGESNCPKRTAELQNWLESCLLVDDSVPKDCLINVWSKPWENFEEITVTCEPARRKRALKGANYSQKMLRISKPLEDERKFTNFQKKYNKIYSSEEERAVRFRIFQENMQIAQNLQEYEQGTAVYGPTIFADLTPNEFRTKHLGYRPDLKNENNIPLAKATIPNIELPLEFDWRHYNVVTEVKNQGSCGSCWAFSVTGNVEGQYAIKHKKLLSLSEQELVDCDKLDEGCNGGLQENAYRALEELGGLELENDYPYDGEDEKCHFLEKKAAVKVVSAVNITSNETEMAQWLVQNGPMAIGINANAMQFYMGGISHPFRLLCDPGSLDHGVLIVGYGIHEYPLFNKTIPYWIVKNSWGKRWGEQGYYRIYRGDGSCGVNADVSSAIVA
ncbi:uncharacterized protein [Fopius arisanus]|uniref:Uncharacterized protein n=1 Tax=Fopius arisanus TaxID=64838 RepID=A0A9R1U6Z9_9HYME|nr:PREDICTED: uncharacterized protein LOC105270293 [Fopius arisanus]